MKHRRDLYMSAVLIGTMLAIVVLAWLTGCVPVTPLPTPGTPTETPRPTLDQWPTLPATGPAPATVTPSPEPTGTPEPTATPPVVTATITAEPPSATPEPSPTPIATARPTLPPEGWTCPPGWGCGEYPVDELFLYEPYRTMNVRSAPIVGANNTIGAVYPGSEYTIVGQVYIAIPLFDANGESLGYATQHWFELATGGYTVYSIEGEACGATGNICGRYNIPSQSSKLGLQSVVAVPQPVVDLVRDTCISYAASGAEDKLDQIRAACPDALLINRVYDAECGSDWTLCRSIDGWGPPAQTVASRIASQSWRWEGRDVCVQLVANEWHPDPNNYAASVQDYAASMYAMIEQFEARGECVVIGHWSVGTPAYADWAVYAPVMERCNEYNRRAGEDKCLVAFHEYPGGNAPLTWYNHLFGRIINVAALLAVWGVEMPPTAILETAGGEFVAGGVPWSLAGDAGLVPVGYSPAAWSMAVLREMDKLYRITPFVRAAHIFTAGSVPPWGGYDLYPSEHWDLFEQFIRALFPVR